MTTIQAESHVPSEEAPRTPSPAPLTIEERLERTAKESKHYKPLLFPEMLGDETVTILVGPLERKFTIHKKLLKASCSYFRAAFSSGFKEESAGIMCMPEDFPEHMIYLTTLLYRGSVPNPLACRSSLILRGLYCFAEKLCYTSLMNKIMDEMITYHATEVFGPNRFFKYLMLTDSRKIYASTHAGSKLRYYWATVNFLSLTQLEPKPEKMVEHAAFFDEFPEFCSDSWEWQIKYLRRFLSEPLDKRRHFIRDKVDRCVFHVHERGDMCGGELAEKNLVE